MIQIGVDFGGTKIEAAALAPDGGVVARLRTPTPASYDAALAAVRDLVDRIEAETGARGTVGVGAPGSISPRTGVMRNANAVYLNGRRFREDLSQALARPVRLANDANCLALSEATDGAGAGSPVVFAAILGTGTGAGIAVNGQVLTGPNGLAGEWGHNPLPFGVQGAPDEDPLWRCYCGRSGCVESLVSGPGLAREHALRHGGTLDAAAIALEAADGNAACQATLQRHANRLARALAAVINLLDPDVIVLGGGLSSMSHLYADVPALWSQWVFTAGSGEPVRTRLLPALHGDASGVRGAAWLWKR